MLTLGNRQFSSTLVQAPLAGISCAPFRRLLWQYGGLAFANTEMIAANTLLQAPTEATRRYFYVAPDEGPLCLQLSGADPARCAEATAVAMDLGITMVDLNCGCPKPKIRNKGTGSAHLEKPTRLYKILSAMRGKTNGLLSMKMRVGDTLSVPHILESVRAAQEAGCDFITVHGRHWQEHYETPVRWDAVAEIIERTPLPVIANGDIACADSFKYCLQQTDAVAGMVGRGSIGKPWLFKKIQCAQNGEAFTPPDHKTQGELLLQHIHDLATLSSPFSALLQSRRLAKHYAFALSDKRQFLERVVECDDMTSFDNCVKTFFSC